MIKYFKFTSPNSIEKIGIDSPFPIAAIEPIIIKIQSVLVANLNNFQKGTYFNFSFVTLLPLACKLFLASSLLLLLLHSICYF